MKPKVMLAGVALAAVAAATPKPVAGPPQRVATCVSTSVRWVGERLEDGRTHASVAGSGSSVRLANGVLGVSYDQEPSVDGSRPGDPVITCLVKLPRHCPPGDARGRWYTTTNLRTLRSWTLPDAEHMCGGA